jgi:hypothetical protein
MLFIAIILLKNNIPKYGFVERKIQVSVLPGLSELPARGFRALACLLHDTALGQLVQRLTGHDLNPAILGAVEGPVPTAAGMMSATATNSSAWSRR